jgi:hypothetical protein
MAAADPDCLWDASSRHLRCRHARLRAKAMAASPKAAANLAVSCSTAAVATHHGNENAEAQEAGQADGRKAAGSAAGHPVQQAGPTLQRHRRLLCHLLCHPRCLHTTMVPCWS